MNAESLDPFVDTFRKLRRLFGWTQADLAKRLSKQLGHGVAPGIISTIETGNRVLDLAEARGLAKVFGGTIALVGVDESDMVQAALRAELDRHKAAIALLQEQITSHNPQTPGQTIERSRRIPSGSAEPNSADPAPRTEDDQ